MKKLFNFLVLSIGLMIGSATHAALEEWTLSESHSGMEAQHQVLFSLIQRLTSCPLSTSTCLMRQEQ